jgi:hypothetical protein
MLRQTFSQFQITGFCWDNIADITYSTSQATVLSYVSMFESFMKLTKLYEDSQLKLNNKTDELEAMKRYLHEVLKEVDKFKQTKQ